MDLRDKLIDFIEDWVGKTGFSQKRILEEMGLPASKFYDWKKRYGKVNAHNGRVPRDYWLQEWEIEAIQSFFTENPDVGYRRLTYMMMDQDAVAVSPSATYNVLRKAGLILKPDGKTSTIGKGFTQPEQTHLNGVEKLTSFGASGFFLNIELWQAHFPHTFAFSKP